MTIVLHEFQHPDFGRNDSTILHVLISRIVSYKKYTMGRENKPGAMVELDYSEKPRSIVVFETPSEIDALIKEATA